MDTRTSPARLRIERIQEALRAAGCAAVVVPSSDPHLSEYLPERWQARQWASGFTGSVATLVVTTERAALFADSRYWVQAERELAGSGIELVRIPTPPRRAARRLAVRERRARHDGRCRRQRARPRRRRASCATTLGQCEIALRSDLDVVAAAWPERPTPPAATRLRALRAPEAPHSRAGKLAQVRAAMRDAGATHHLISTVDDIAWLLNLRGADVGYNPVFLGPPCSIDADAATLFVGAGKIDAALARALAADGVRVAPYDDVAGALAALPADARLLVDPRRTTLGPGRDAAAPRASRRSTRARSRRAGRARPRRPTCAVR